MLQVVFTVGLFRVYCFLLHHCPGGGSVDILVIEISVRLFATLMTWIPFSE